MSRTDIKDDELITTYTEAESLNEFFLAQRWANRSRLPFPAPLEKRGVLAAKGVALRQVEHELDELATMAVLARRLNGWLPGQIQAAIVRGATKEQIEDATRMPILTAVARWQEWIDGQIEHAGLAPGSYGWADYQTAKHIIEQHEGGDDPLAGWKMRPVQ